MSKFATLWFWEKQPLNEKWNQVYSFDTPQYPKPSLIKQADIPTDSEPFSWTELDGQGRLRAHVTHEHLPEAPSMWFVYGVRKSQPTATQTLIAFSTPEFPDGTILGLDDAKEMNLDPMKRIAAINWGLNEPKLYQLYVDANHRRKRIGTKLINICDIVHVATGLGGFIYGGDQVTEMGEQYGQAWVGSTRRQEPRTIMPSMD